MWNLRRAEDEHKCVSTNQGDVRFEGNEKSKVEEDDKEKTIIKTKASEGGNRPWAFS